MGNQTVLLITLHVVASLLAVDALHCLLCQNMADPRECLTTTNCGANQSCFTQTTYTSLGAKFFMGCLENELCQKPGGAVFGRRAGDSPCLECCTSDHCNTDLCQPATSWWGQWMAWGGCSASCDVGLATRRRTCVHHTSGGAGCHGDDHEHRICMEQRCANGGWSEWGSWGACAVTCGTGMTSRTRRCDNPPPSTFGLPCMGSDRDTKLCGTDSCASSGGGGGGGQHVFFSVHNPRVVDHVLTFQEVVANVQDVYNRSSGYFRAPVGGLYFFTSQICVSNNNVFEETNIKKADPTMRHEVILAAMRKGTDGNYDCSTESTVTELNAGEYVWVYSFNTDNSRITENGPMYWSAFSGALMSRA